MKGFVNHLLQKCSVFNNLQDLNKKNNDFNMLINCLIFRHFSEVADFAKKNPYSGCFSPKLSTGTVDSFSLDPKPITLQLEKNHNHFDR